MAEDPELPDLDSVAAWIRETRNRLNITLTELGEAAHLSPSQLSRLESSEGNPSYEAIYRVYNELKRRQSEASVAAVLRSKRDGHDNLRFEYVTPTDTCATVGQLMDEYDISQLPVLKDERVVGGVTDTDLIELDGDATETTIDDIAGPPFPEVSVTSDQETVRNLLRRNPGVLLTADEDTEFTREVGPYVGIVTAADFR